MTTIKSIDARMSAQLNARELKGRRRCLAIYAGHDFCSNDYLGLARSEQQAQGLVSSGSTGSRLVSGNSVLVEQFECEAAQFHGMENSLLFSSGYAANTGLLSCIAQHDDLLILDSLAHASLIDGARLSRASHRYFNHNDLPDLKRILDEFNLNRSSVEQRAFVVVESLYSMDGDCAPLIELAALCRQSNASLIVDEAHAIGVYGNEGAGLVAQHGLQPDVFAVIFTYGKAMGRHGAIVAGSHTLRDYLINYCRPFIYTTAPSPESVQGLINSYQVMRKADAARQSLQANVLYFKQQVVSMSFCGAQWLDSSSPIQALIIGHTERAKALAQQCHEAGFALKAITSPTVPKGSDRIRICLHAHNTHEQINSFVNILQANITLLQDGSEVLK